MRCAQCGSALSNDSNTCPVCHKDGSVKILSRIERDSFDGETIDTTAIGNPGSRGNYYESGRQRRCEGAGFGQRLYKFSLLPTTFWGRAALVMATGLLFFVALPLFFLAVLFGTVIGMLFFKRK